MGFQGMRRFFAIGLLSVISFAVDAQTCTITGTNPINWVNPGPSCVEGGNAGAYSILVIPAGKTVNIGGADTWTGTRIDVSGTLNITADVTFNSTIIVKNGGLMDLQAKLFLGSTSGCGYGAGAQTGGTINVGGTGSDRLTVCGVEMMKGNGSCNSCGGTNSGTCAYNGSPYCEPTGGFTGPTGYGETGYTTTLPIRLVGFAAEVVGNHVQLNWATDKEENFDHFEVERANNDLVFTTVASIPGTGAGNAYTEYVATDKNPLIGTNYYRLKAVDRDQSYEYVKLVSVDYIDSKDFVVVPNPSKGSLIKYQINFTPRSDDQVILIDAVGNEVQREHVEGTVNELVPVKTLRPGTYLLRYVSGNFQRTTRLFVKD